MKKPKPLEPRSFKDFRTTSRLLESGYIKYGELEIYIRNGLPQQEVDFVIANIKSAYPGGGGLTDFLNKYEKHFSFMFESVLNRRLAKHLQEKRNYGMANEDVYCPNLVKRGAKHHGIWIRTNGGMIRNPDYVEPVIIDEEVLAHAFPVQDVEVQANGSGQVQPQPEFPDTPDGRARRRRAERQAGLSAV